MSQPPGTCNFLEIWPAILCHVAFCIHAGYSPSLALAPPVTNMLAASSHIADDRIEIVSFLSIFQRLRVNQNMGLFEIRLAVVFYPVDFSLGSAQPSLVAVMFSHLVYPCAILMLCVQDCYFALSKYLLLPVSSAGKP